MAQQPNYGALSDASVEQAQIERARRYAELMQAQSAQPMDTNQTAGGWVVPVSPLAGVAKMFQAYSGKKGMEEADARQKALAERLKSEREQADARVMAAASGAPNLATDPTRLATALPQWMTDAQPDLVPKQPTREEIRQNVLAAAMAHPEMRGPALGAFLQQMTANPESQFAKIDPSKFTAESVAKFAQTNRHSDLVPRDRLDFQNIGGQVVGLNPFSGAKQTSIDTSMRPGEAARLDWDKYQFGNLSEQQRQSLGIDRARLANQGIETLYNTGQGVGSPMFSGLPQTAPMQFTNTGGGTPAPAAPPVAPQAPRPVGINPAAPRPMAVAPNAVTQNSQPAGRPLPQKLQDAAALKSIEQVNDMENKRNFNMGGLGDTIDEAKKLLSGVDSNGKPVAGYVKPTNSGTGAVVDYMANKLFGVSPSGDAQAAQLEALGGSLLSKMPRMEGPQSDRDVQNYREMSGQVGDKTLPVEKRLAALKEVERLYRKYDKQDKQQPYNGPRTNLIAPQGMNAARAGNVMEQADAILAGGR